jgi:hypothetical protein
MPVVKIVLYNRPPCAFYFFPVSRDQYPEYLMGIASLYPSYDHKSVSVIALRLVPCALRLFFKHPASLGLKHWRFVFHDLSIRGGASIVLITP